MDIKKRLFFGAAALFFITVFLVIIFGKNGYIDLLRLEAAHLAAMEKNNAVDAENQQLTRTIQRLKSNDPAYIENVAKQELGMIAEDEVIFKFKKALKQK